MMYIVLVLVASSALADDQSALQEFIISNHKFASSIYKVTKFINQQEKKL